MTQPIKMTSTLALLAAVLLLSLAFMRGLSSDLHVPAAQILVAECQGFEALATAGGKRLTCSADVAALTGDVEPQVPGSSDTGDAAPAPAPAPVVPTVAHKKV